jgi:DNA polymerase
MRDDLAILLDWFVANGVGEFFDDEAAPREWSMPSESKERKNGNLESMVQALAKQQRSLRGLASGGFAEIREKADRADGVDDIVRVANGLDVYSDFRRAANNTIVLVGRQNSDIMLVNDIPSDEDDISGSIFGGQAAGLVEKMFSSIDVGSDRLCFINSFFWRLPGNRAPIKEELEICRPIVERIISFIKPKLIIFCGNYSVSSLLEQNKTIASLRGKFVYYSNCYMQSTVAATGIYSPLFLMKNGDKKKDIWTDLLKIKRFLEET